MIDAPQPMGKSTKIKLTNTVPKIVGAPGRNLTAPGRPNATKDTPTMNATGSNPEQLTSQV
jgi:hypothetical protein